MRNFLLSFASIALFSGILQLFLPWWIIAPVSFLIGCFFIQKPFKSFLAGFLGIFLLWVVYSYVLSSGNNHLLAAKVANLLPLNGNVTLLLLVTGLIGGLVGGFSALTGSLAWKVKES